MAITSKLVDIADAIREMTGENGVMTMAQMPAKIRSIGGETPPPTISVSSAGLVTASCNGISSTHQLSVADDSDFVASNIKSGISIFGVSGSYAPSYDTPSITVNTSGLITASANGKSNTLQLSSSQDADFVAANILSGKNIFGVSGSLAIQTFYTGSSTPSSSLGSNGDLYLMTS